MPSFSDKIVDLHRKHRSVYGLRKLWKAAIRDDIDIGRDHLGRLMGALGLRGVVRGKANGPAWDAPQRQRAGRIHHSLGGHLE